MLKALSDEEQASETISSHPGSGASISRGAALWATIMLSMVGLLAAVDRNILSLLLVPIKHDLKVSDSAMGALTGTVFALVYSITALPMARLADRTSRRNLIVAAVAFWSAMTAVCGLAGNYVQLLIARMGVGIGEAPSGPATMSMIGDLYPAHRRGVAISILTIGSALGFALGAYVSGVLNDHYGWHVAMMAVGAPGLILAALIWFTVPEPVRGAHDGGVAPDPDAASVWRSLRNIFRTPTAAPLLLGMICLNVAFLGWLNWLPAFLMRAHHLTTTQMSAIFGVVIGIGGVLANVVAGFASDWVARRGTRWRMYYCFAMTVLAVPPLVAALLLKETTLAVLCMCAFTLAAGGLTTVTGASVLSIARPGQRAFMSAVFGLAVSILGAGAGPWIIGATNDALKGAYGELAIRYSLLLIPAMLALSGVMFLWASRTIDRDAAASVKSRGA